MSAKIEKKNQISKFYLYFLFAEAGKGYYSRSKGAFPARHNGVCSCSRQPSKPMHKKAVPEACVVKRNFWHSHKTYSLL